MTILLWILSGLLLILPTTVHGFASNLVTTTIGCMTELDTSEVIMNNVVKSPEQSDFPKMHLEVVDNEHSSNNNNKNNNNKNNNNNPSSSPNHYYYQSNELTIAFVNPYSRDEFPDDLQFVIQLQPGDAEFVDGGAIGCEGNQRISARFQDNHGKVQLQIHDMSASFRLWAGWATGQNAVRLTPPLLLEPYSSAADGIANGADANGADANPNGADANPNSADANPNSAANANGAADANEQDTTKKQEQNADSQNNKIDVSNNNEGDTQKHDSKPRGGGQQSGYRRRIIQKEAEAKKRAPAVQKSPALAPLFHRNNNNNNNPRPVYDEAKRRQELAAQMDKNFPDTRSFMVRYEKGIDFDTHWHLYGCCFFLTTTGLCMLLLGKRREKGRRDL